MKIIYAIALFFAINNANACDATVPDFVESIREQVIIVGEWHGTKEMPAFAGNLVCYYAKKNIPVLLGLEMPSSMQASINNYHLSPGNKQERAELLSVEFWGRTGKFGTASNAIFDLLELSRQLRSDGYQLMPFAYDMKDVDMPIPLIKGEPFIFQRDLLMAANIQTRAIQYKNHKIIILAGNGHARKGADSLSMAAFLTKSTPNVAIGFNSLGGQAWNCTGKSATAMVCGSQPIEAMTMPPGSGFDHIANLKELHASPPAVDDRHQVKK